jgi:sulfoquinovose isomerase
VPAADPPDPPIDPAVLDQEGRRLLAFGRGFPHPDGGAAWLDENGRPDLTKPVHTWITARMAHVYCLGDLLGVEGAGELADVALDGLRGRLRDRRYGGWISAVDPDGSIPDEKSCYAHAFVVLAASSASVVGRNGAEELLAEALEEWDANFWEEPAGMYLDSTSRTFADVDPYRGVNANMHAVEALLAAADATGEVGWRARAVGIAERVVAAAEHQRWRIPEHFDVGWHPRLDLNRDRPGDPFRPYGATVGHGLEWSRLLLHLEASLGRAAPSWLESAARSLFERAASDGWSVDGAEGFVYTTDWDGTPVVRDRMHWVVAEGFAAACALHTRTGEDRYRDLARTWWEYAETYLMDFGRGSWHHQLDSENRPTATVWPGKPDVYHAVQATLLPGLPLAPSLTTALQEVRSRSVAQGSAEPASGHDGRGRRKPASAATADPEEPLGPVDLSVIQWAGRASDARLRGVLDEALASGAVRILAALVVEKAEDGAVRIRNSADFPGPSSRAGLAALAQDRFVREEAAQVAAELPEGTSALVVAWENTWTVRLRAALSELGGAVTRHERIGPRAGLAMEGFAVEELVDEVALEDVVAEEVGEAELGEEETVDRRSAPGP